MITKNFKTDIEQYVINSVRDMRNKLKISQAELALLIDVSVGFIGHVESHKHRAKYNLNHLNKLALALNCEFKDFFPEKPLQS